MTPKELIKTTFAFSDEPTLVDAIFESPEHVRTLNLSDANLTHLPQFLTRFPNLRELYLNNNCLTWLDPKILLALPLLESLYVCNNLLRTLPDEISRLSRLTDLEASGNLLKTVPACLSRMVSLRNLALENNILQHLPNSFSNLINLGFLGLANNLFTDVPRVIAYMPRLHSITICRENNLELELPAVVMKDESHTIQLKNDQVVLHLAKSGQLWR